MVCHTIGGDSCGLGFGPSMYEMNIILEYKKIQIWKSLIRIDLTIKDQIVFEC